MWLSYLLIALLLVSTTTFVAATDTIVADVDIGEMKGVIEMLDYVNNVDHTWHIHSEQNGALIAFKFQKFDVEAHSECAYDWLTMYDAPLVNASKIMPEGINGNNKMCGSTPVHFADDTNLYFLGQELVTTGPDAFFTFHSDASITNKGFTLNWNLDLPSVKVHPKAKPGQLDIAIPVDDTIALDTYNYIGLFFNKRQSIGSTFTYSVTLQSTVSTPNALPSDYNPVTDIGGMSVSIDSNGFVNITAASSAQKVDCYLWGTNSYGYSQKFAFAVNAVATTLPDATSYILCDPASSNDTSDYSITECYIFAMNNGEPITASADSFDPHFLPDSLPGAFIVGYGPLDALVGAYDSVFTFTIEFSSFGGYVEIDASPSSNDMGINMTIIEEGFAPMDASSFLSCNVTSITVGEVFSCDFTPRSLFVLVNLKNGPKITYNQYLNPANVDDPMNYGSPLDIWILPSGIWRAEFQAPYDSQITRVKVDTNATGPGIFVDIQVTDLADDSSIFDCEYTTISKSRSMSCFVKPQMGGVPLFVNASTMEIQISPSGAAVACDSLTTRTAVKAGHIADVHVNSELTCKITPNVSYEGSLPTLFTATLLIDGFQQDFTHEITIETIPLPDPDQSRFICESSFVFASSPQGIKCVVTPTDDFGNPIEVPLMSYLPSIVSGKGSFTAVTAVNTTAYPNVTTVTTGDYFITNDKTFFNFIPDSSPGNGGDIIIKNGVNTQEMHLLVGDIPDVSATITCPQDVGINGEVFCKISALRKGRNVYCKTTQFFVGVYDAAKYDPSPRKRLSNLVSSWTVDSLEVFESQNFINSVSYGDTMIVGLSGATVSGDVIIALYVLDTQNEWIPTNTVRTLTVTDVPDETSTLECASDKATSNVPMRCWINPKKAGVSISASAQDIGRVVPYEIHINEKISEEGVESYSQKDIQDLGHLPAQAEVGGFFPPVGSRLYFDVVVRKSNTQIDLICMLCQAPNNLFTFHSLAAPSSLSWAQTQAFVDKQIDVLTLGRNNKDGQIPTELNTATGANGNTPHDFISMSCTDKFCVGASRSGRCYSWGKRASFVPVPGANYPDTFIPSELLFLTFQGHVFVMVSAVGETSFALTDAGILFEWDFQSTDPRVVLSTAAHVPMVVTAAPVTLISNRGSYILAATADGNVYSWVPGQQGKNGEGGSPFLSYGSFAFSNMGQPKMIISVPAPVTHLVAGTSFGFIVSQNTALYTWGSGFGGALLSSTLAPQLAPVNAERFGGEEIKSIDSSEAFALVVTVTGHVYHLPMNFDPSCSELATFAILKDGWLNNRFVEKVSIGVYSATLIDSEGAIWQMEAHSNTVYSPDNCDLDGADMFNQFDFFSSGSAPPSFGACIVFECWDEVRTQACECDGIVECITGEDENYCDASSNIFDYNSSAIPSSSATPSYTPSYTSYSPAPWLMPLRRLLNVDGVETLEAQPTSRRILATPSPQVSVELFPKQFGNNPSLNRDIVGGDVYFIYDNYFSFISQGPATVVIDPDSSELAENCGTISKTCTSLKLALERFPLQGTKFALSQGYHMLHEPLRSRINDLYFLAEDPSDPSLTILDCQNKRCFELEGGGYKFAGFTIINGGSVNTTFAGAVDIQANSYYYFYNMVFEQCGSTNTDGGVFSLGKGSILIVAHSHFIENEGQNGGVLTGSADNTIIIFKSVFHNNIANKGGAISLVSGYLYLLSSTFLENNATEIGGVLVGELSQGAIVNSTFMGNSAGVKAGALYFASSKMVVNTTFLHGNTATAGGALFMDFAKMILLNSIFLENVASGSGGALNCLGDLGLIVDGTTFTANTATFGGALSSVYCSPQVSNSVFDGNLASGYGGGLLIGTQSALVIVDSTLSNNAAGLEHGQTEGVVNAISQGLGGAVMFLDPNPCVVANCVFTANKAYQGAGIYAGGEKQHTFQFTTFNLNEAAAGAGIFWDYKIPITDSVTYSNNQASHGPAIASIASKLGVSGLPPNFSIGSAEVFNVPLTVTLLDQYDQVVFTDFSTRTTVETNFPGANINGVSKGVFYQGTYTYNGTSHFGITYLPDSTVDFNISATTADTTVHASLTVDLRACKAGEKLLGTDRCVPCDAGFFGTSVISTTCESCAAGTSQSLPGQTSCDVCVPGTYSAGSATECVLCDAAKQEFQNVEGKSNCRRCPTASSPTTTNGIMLDGFLFPLYTSCSCDSQYLQVPCDNVLNAGFESICSNEVTNWENNCVTCPEGANCLRNGTTVENVKAAAGFSAEIGGTNTVFYECFNDACNAKGECNPGYTGPLCNLCDIGYGISGNYQCSLCPQPDLNRLRLVGAGILVLIGIAVMTAMTVRGAKNMQHKEKHAIYFKILTSALQFNSLAASFDYGWPDIVKEMLDTQSVAANASRSFMSVDCFFTANDPVSAFWVTTILMFVLPLMLGTCVVLFFTFRYNVFKFGGSGVGAYNSVMGFYNRKRSLPTFIPEQQDEEMRQFFGKSNEEANFAFKDILKAEFISSVVVSLFLIHPSLVQQCFASISCYQIGANDDDLYLLEDLSFKCYSNEHYLWIWFIFLPMFIFEVIGIPLAAFYLLYRDRASFALPPDHEERIRVTCQYGFLFDGYELDSWFWEIVVVFRKVFLVCIAVYWASDTHRQTLMAIVLCLIALTAQMKFQPFESQDVDDMESLSLFTTCSTFILGQFLFVLKESEDTERVFLSVAIVILNVAFYALMIYRIVMEVKRGMDEKKLKKKMQEDEEEKVEMATLKKEDKEDVAAEEDVVVEEKKM